MRKAFPCAVLTLLLSVPARALTLPDWGRYYFTGSTTQLLKIRAAMAKVAGYPPSSWQAPYSNPSQLLDAPFGMGEIDCLDSAYWPDQGPFDGSEDYLGMSVELEGEIVEIPMLEDLVTVHTMPERCYGYLFHEFCGDPVWAAFACADPPPEMDGGT